MQTTSVIPPPLHPYPLARLILTLVCCLSLLLFFYLLLSVLGMVLAAIEYPFVAADYFNTPSSFMPRVAFYIPLSVISLLEAQTVNGGVYLAIGTVAYLLAIRDDFKKQQSASMGRAA